MHSFFVSPRVLEKDKILITGPDVKHISRVLRLGEGDVIEILDGRGGAARARIEGVSKDAVTCSRLETYEPSGLPPVRVTILQGLAKGEKMEVIIQKATELGVSGVIPVVCRRSVVQLDQGKVEARLERWRRVALEAAKQCRRPDIPVVGVPVDFAAALQAVPGDVLLLMPWEAENSRHLREVLSGDNKRDVFILIGPEGGFDPGEVDLAVGRGALTVSLGPRILRTETAGPACLAVIMYQWGDLG